MTDLPRFDFCISNPPYQLDDAHQRKIYPQFFLQGGQTAHVTCIIMPSAWRSTRGRGTVYEAERMRGVSGIKSITDYANNPKGAGADVFPTAGTGEVNIVVVDDTYIDQGVIEVASEGSPHQLLPANVVFASSRRMLDPHVRSVLEHTRRATPKSVVHHLTSQTVNGIFVSRHLGDDPQYSGFFSTVPVDGWLRLHHNDGVARWVSPAAPFVRPRNFQKLAIPSTGTHRQFRDSFVLGPADVVSNVYITAEFATLEEVLNFQRYMGSNLYRYLLAVGTLSHNGIRSTHNFVPDLGDYTNNNPIFACDDQLPPNHPYIGVSLDERLYNFFDLPEDDINSIEAAVDDRMRRNNPFIQGAHHA